MHKPTRRLLAQFLRTIPQSNQDAQSLSQLADSLEGPASCDLLLGCAQMLSLLGMIALENSASAAEARIRASSQTAKYALMSLADYFESEISLIDDWKTRGTQLAPGENLLKNGASLLFAMEQRRASLLHDPAPVREARVAQALINRHNPDTGRREFLFQFDVEAGRYQLIGGRWRESDGADLAATMIREIEEELADNALHHGEDYQLHPLLEAYHPPPVISPTFGALTRYTFSIYHLRGLHKPLQLQSGDRWMSLEEIVSASVDHPSISVDLRAMLDAIEARLPGGLKALPLSFAGEL